MTLKWLGKEGLPMPWKETSPVEERFQFVLMHLKEPWRTFAGMCDAFGVSRKTGYKWLERYEIDGLDGLRDQSRAPHHRPQAIADELAERLVAARREHPTWGPRKLLAWLRAHETRTSWPVPSTVGELLKRHGLVRPQRRRLRVPRSTQPFGECREPNDLWCTDFKGHFCTADGVRCHPLTLTDGASRYLLRCRALPNETTAPAKRIFESAFREYGLPHAMRSDNGPPFATPNGGISSLAVWWIKLDIRPERIEPGQPQQNGRHERMHRTLKAETARPPRANIVAQQRAFDSFRREYNDERPHEALAQKPPAAVYRPSARPYPRKVAEVEYPSGFDVRSVRHDGLMKWRGEMVHVSGALAGERVGLEPIDDGLWRLSFGRLVLGALDETAGRVLVRRAFAWRP